MKIIIGLGNPGDKYKHTRHNAGFMALDALQARLGYSWQSSKKFNARYSKTPDMIYVKPLSMMNNSGNSVQSVMAYYKLLPKTLGLVKQKNSNLSQTLTVIHDDMDIELGKYKISIDSRSAGHRGVESIINHLKTKNFKRIRIGIKTGASAHYPAKHFVLQNFNREELKTVDKAIQQIITEFLS